MMTTTWSKRRGRKSGDLGRVVAFKVHAIEFIGAGGRLAIYFGEGREIFLVGGRALTLDFLGVGCITHI